MKTLCVLMSGLLFFSASSLKAEDPETKEAKQKKFEAQMAETDLASRKAEAESIKFISGHDVDYTKMTLKELQDLYEKCVAYGNYKDRMAAQKERESHALSDFNNWQWQAQANAQAIQQAAVNQWWQYQAAQRGMTVEQYQDWLRAQQAQAQMQAQQFQLQKQQADAATRAARAAEDFASQLQWYNLNH